jgi:hypothetical protein
MSMFSLSFWDYALSREGRRQGAEGRRKEINLRFHYRWFDGLKLAGKALLNID